MGLHAACGCPALWRPVLPFAAPDGIDKLPANQPSSKSVRLRPALFVSAMMTIAELIAESLRIRVNNGIHPFGSGIFSAGPFVSNHSAIWKTQMKTKPSKIVLAGAVLLLALMAVLADGAARRESVTVDEVAHIGAGVSCLQKLDMRMNEEHP